MVGHLARLRDYDDVMGAVDHAIEMGYADPDRLAVFGYSYGGYMTNVVITNSNRFKAVIRYVMPS